MKKLYIFMLVTLILFSSGCNDNKHNFYTPNEVYQIVNDTLTKGEIANLIYLGQFSTTNDDILTPESNLSYGYIVESEQLPLPTNGDIWKLIKTFNNTDDIKTYIRKTFIPSLAEQYLMDIFTSNGNKYVFQNNQLLQCRYLATYPISLIKWEHQPIEIIINKQDKLQVMLKGNFMLTGLETTLPLTLTKINDQWLLDESFSPQEQEPKDYYYNPTELKNILEDTLTKANKANQLYVADNFHIIPNSERKIFSNVSTYAPEYNYDIYYGIINTKQPDEDYADLIREFTTTEAIKQCYNEAFVNELAQFYINNLFIQDYPTYIDQPEGLAYKLNIACMPITMLNWQPDDYFIWKNSEKQIIVIMGAEYPHFNYGYYPLRLQLIDGKWLCDKSYEISASKISWQLK